MILGLVISSLALTGAMENAGLSYSNLQGSTGTLRTFSAKPNLPEYFSLGLAGSFMSAEPFINARKHSRSSLLVNGNYTWGSKFPIETYAGFGFTFNESSTATQSNTMTTYFENAHLGVRMGSAGPRFFYGGHLQGSLFSGTRALRNTSGGTTQKSGPFATAEAAAHFSLDYVERFKSFPFRSHLNFGYRLPNSDLVGANQDFNKFSLDAMKYHSLFASVSIETMYKYVKPFIEASGEYALNTSAVGFSDNRNKLSLGARVTPFPVMALLLAADIGLGGIQSGDVAGMPRNPPWELWFAAHFSVDRPSLSNAYGAIKGAALDDETGLPLDGVQVSIASESQAPQLTDLAGAYDFNRIPNGTYDLVFSKAGYETQNRRVTVRDGRDSLLDARMRKAGPKMGGLVAQVVDVETNAPINRAIVNVSGVDTALSTDSDGRLRIGQIAEGPHSVRVEAPGYLAQDFQVDIRGNEIADQKFALQKAPPETGTCAGVVKNPDGTPLTAVITAEDGSVKPFATDPLTGEYSALLPPGQHKLKVQAENYLPQTVDCDVTAGQRTDLSVTLEKPKAATVVDNKIVLPDAIYFEFGSAVIKEESFPILDQVGDILLKTEGIAKLHVDGHTDHVGSDDFNKKLSKQRAESVKKYLVQKGVRAAKITARGFGESKPVATNQTAEGRAENRRVEFNLNGQ